MPLIFRGCCTSSTIVWGTWTRVFCVRIPTTSICLFVSMASQKQRLQRAVTQIHQQSVVLLKCWRWQGLGAQVSRILGPIYPRNCQVAELCLLFPDEMIGNVNMLLLGMVDGVFAPLLTGSIILVDLRGRQTLIVRLDRTWLR